MEQGAGTESTRARRPPITKPIPLTRDCRAPAWPIHGHSVVILHSPLTLLPFPFSPFPRPHAQSKKIFPLAARRHAVGRTRGGTLVVQSFPDAHHRAESDGSDHPDRG